MALAWTTSRISSGIKVLKVVLYETSFIGVEFINAVGTTTLAKNWTANISGMGSGQWSSHYADFLNERFGLLLFFAISFNEFSYRIWTWSALM